MWCDVALLYAVLCWTVFCCIVLRFIVLYGGLAGDCCAVQWKMMRMLEKRTHGKSLGLKKYGSTLRFLSLKSPITLLKS